MKKIVTIVGARPQFIKAATISRQFQHYGVEEKIVHTGQHFDENMSAVFFSEMEIPPPTYQLNIHSLAHGAMTGRMLEEIEKILLAEQPDAVLVYGDTNSTLAGALAASKLNIKVIHVEAGLRSFNRNMPEEINRVITDRLSSVLFCPTDTAVANLTKEGFAYSDCSIVKNGDVMYDAILYYAHKAEQKSTILKKINLQHFALATLHRQENTDDIEKLKKLIASLNKLHQTISVVMPIHPRTQSRIAKVGIPIDFNIIDPVGYFDIIMLLKQCTVVLTDSGGLQKEAFFMKKHCVVLRDETEWTELVDLGFNTLANDRLNELDIVINELMLKKMDFNINLFGNGQAAAAAAKYIAEN